MHDGYVGAYKFPGFTKTTPRLIYVNGIQTPSAVHRDTAVTLSQITQREVIGVYNKTAEYETKTGIILDLLQCGGDWLNGFTSQVGEFGFDAVNYAIDRVRSWRGRSNRSPADVAAEIRRRVPAGKLAAFLHDYLALTNKASAALFITLDGRLGARQWIVAHSQGNLVTASALWALQTLHGATGLQNLQIYSIASPAPAWPAGINHRIKVYGHTNDYVTLADPKNWPLVDRRSEGDWRAYADPAHEGRATKKQMRDDNLKFKPHDIAVNFFGTNFVTRIRTELGLGPWSNSQGDSQPYRPGDAIHVVNAGESLSLIAKHYTGAATRWEEMYQENKGSIGADPNRLAVGQRLRLPSGWKRS